MSHLVLSFQSGIVRPMLATRNRPAVMGRFFEEAVARCENMQQAADVIDKETFTVIGTVKWQFGGYVYTTAENSDEIART